MRIVIVFNFLYHFRFYRRRLVVQRLKGAAL